MLDLVSDGRVEFGTGRSSTRAEIEGFGLDPHETREMWDEALQHIVGIWTNEEYSFDGKHWQMPPRRVHPKPVAEAAPADLGRDVERRRPLRDGQARHRAVVVHGRQPAREPRGAHRRTTAAASPTAREPVGKFVNEHRRDLHDGALQRHQREGARRSRGVVRLVPADRRRTPSRRSPSGWKSRGQELGNYGYAGEARKGEQAGLLRPPHDGLPLRHRRGRRRRPRPVHRDLQALRGGRLRAAVLPAQPVQHSHDEGHALDRAARNARHPEFDK